MKGEDNMEKVGVEKSLFSKVDHVGIIVRDIDKAIEHYQSLGIGPFRPFNIAYTERKMRGKPAGDVKNIVRVAQMGQIQLELIQPVEGESLPKEFLETKGEGISHIGFSVDDVDKERAKLEEKGFTVIYSSRFQNGGGAAHFDTDKVGGVIFELIQMPPE